MESRKLRVFTDGDIDKVADIYHTWRNTGTTYSNIDGMCYPAQPWMKYANRIIN
jgi:type I restriction enzyme M protein